jgi:nucleoside-diphosphate-sugar epimerase
MKKILIVGATGFIGKKLPIILANAMILLVFAVRSIYSLFKDILLCAR